MSSPNILREVGQLRTSLQADSLLRLELLGALARVFREYRLSVSGDLLNALVLALPEELIGTAPGPAAAGRGDVNKIIPPQPGDVIGVIPPQPGDLTTIIPPQPGGESGAIRQNSGFGIIPPQPGRDEGSSARTTAKKTAKKKAAKSAKKTRKR